METRRIYALLETIRLASLNKAAKELGYTNSSLSYMIQELENDLGFHIINRGYKGVSLTEDGARIERFLRRILRDEAELYEAAAAINRKQERKLRIGAYPSFAVSKLPVLLKKFKEANPDVSLELDVNINNLPDMLQAGTIDMYFAQKQLATEQTEWLPIFSDEICAIIPKSYDFSASVFKVSDFEKYPLILPSINANNPISDLSEKIDNPNIINIASCDASAIIALVKQGLGVGFVSEHYRMELGDNVRMRSIEPRLKRNIGIVLSKNREQFALLDKFVGFVSEELGAPNRQLSK